MQVVGPNRGDWRKPALIAVVVGASLWWLVALATGQREPWDASIYWLGAYPAALLACAALGYFHPGRPVLWALLVFEAQFVAMCVHQRELGNLWPLGVALFGIMALPGVFVARLAARYSPRTT